MFDVLKKKYNFLVKNLKAFEDVHDDSWKETDGGGVKLRYKFPKD
jgi:hypothetical protein